MLKRVYRAAGGEGAKSGVLPDDWQAISEEDLRNGFQISTFMVANSIELREGLFFILGGGWSVFRVPALPFDTTWPCLCKANWRRLDGGTVRGLQLSLSNSSGREISRIALELPDVGETQKDFTWVRGLGAPLDEIGFWSIRIISGEMCLSEIEIAVEIQKS